MNLYRRCLPHIHETTQPVFLTWRLHGTLPPNRPFPGGSITSGEAFAAMDKLLDSQCSGPLYLNQPAIADIVVEALHYNAKTLFHYHLHAFVVMPNHVHLLITPSIPLGKLTRSLKGNYSEARQRHPRPHRNALLAARDLRPRDPQPT